MADYNDSMGSYSEPKSMRDHGPVGGPPGRRGAVVFVDRSSLRGAGQPPLSGTFVRSPFAGMSRNQAGKTFKQTYEETYAYVKAKHKWFGKTMLDVWATLTAIPRHLLRHSISTTTYSPTHVAQLESEYKNKL